MTASKNSLSLKSSFLCSSESFNHEHIRAGRSLISRASVHVDDLLATDMVTYAAQGRHVLVDHDDVHKTHESEVLETDAELTRQVNTWLDGDDGALGDREWVAAAEVWPLVYLEADTMARMTRSAVTVFPEKS